MSYMAGKPYAAGEIYWLYPHEHEPPKGVKLHILQEGCVSIQSQWTEGSGFMAWQRMFKRNHEKEQEYRETLIMRKKVT